MARARKWIAAHTPRDTEERTWQLLGLSWAGVTEDRVAFKKRPRWLWPRRLADPMADGIRSMGVKAITYSTAEVLVALHAELRRGDERASLVAAVRRSAFLTQCGWVVACGVAAASIWRS